MLTLFGNSQADHVELQNLSQWLSTWFGKRKTSWKHFQINIKAFFDSIWLRCFDYVCPMFQWFYAIRSNAANSFGKLGLTWAVFRHSKTSFSGTTSLTRSKGA